MDLGISGKIAVVTGGANGIGAETARHLAREGVQVAALDIAFPTSGIAVELDDEPPGSMTGFHVNVADADSVAKAFEQVRSRLGTVQILVNGAGFCRDDNLVDMNEENWDAVVDVTLKGAFLCTRAALPDMIERGWGRIVSISSRAHLGNARQANYSAAKAGLLGFTRAVAMENGPSGVTCNAVAPGLIDTPALRRIPDIDAFVKRAESQTPLCRIGQPADIAATIAFLVSVWASYITGDVVHVTGGRY